MSGLIEVNEISIVRDFDRQAMLLYLDIDGDGTISMEEWIAWHRYVFGNLPSRYSNYTDFLELLETLTTPREPEPPKPLKAKLPSRTKRAARTPRKPRHSKMKE